MACRSGFGINQGTLRKAQAAEEGLVFLPRCREGAGDGQMVRVGLVGHRVEEKLVGKKKMQDTSDKESKMGT